MTMRLEDWPERLDAFIDSRREMPFSWGTNDCASFAASAIEAVTGERPALPSYGGEQAAARLLRDVPLSERADALYGPQIVPAMAQRGDLVLMHLDDRPTLGVSIGDGIAAPGESGVLVFPPSVAVAAWRI